MALSLLFAYIARQTAPKGCHMGFAFKILSIINHPFIINLRGSTQDDKNFYLDLELINGGELFVYLRMADHFTVDQACFYICQVI
jgi:serine/threonine protein kinase